MRKKIGNPYNKSDLISYSSISSYPYISYDDFLRKDKQAQHLIQQGVDLKGLGDLFSDLLSVGLSSDSMGPLDSMKIAFIQQIMKTIQPSIDNIRSQTIQDLRNQILTLLPTMKQKIESGGTPTSRKLIGIIDSKIKSYVPFVSSSLPIPSIEYDVVNEETEPLLNLLPNRDVFVDLESAGFSSESKINVGNPRQMALELYTPEVEDSININIVKPMEKIIEKEIVQPIENRAMLVGTGVFLLGALTTLGGVWAYNKLKSN